MKGNKKAEKSSLGVRRLDENGDKEDPPNEREKPDHGGVTEIQ